MPTTKEKITTETKIKKKITVEGNKQGQKELDSSHMITPANHRKTDLPTNPPTDRQTDRQNNEFI